jgi:excinuclease ABC subunit B
MDDLMNEARRTIDAGFRVLVTTLTKKMAEDLTDYLVESGYKVRYLHSDIDTLERIRVVRGLRLGEYDILVGVNLLREGLDLPEVGLVGILDADKEGFLRGRTALIQTIGRAARNVEGKVVMYADRVTKAMTEAMGETERRQAKQRAYNEEHGITPETIIKGVSDIAEFLSLDSAAPGRSERLDRAKRKAEESAKATKGVARTMSDEERARELIDLEERMLAAAEELRFEEAAKLRDKIRALQ